MTGQISIWLKTTIFREKLHLNKYNSRLPFVVTNMHFPNDEIVRLSPHLHTLSSKTGRKNSKTGYIL